MARNTWPLFSTTKTTWTWSTSASATKTGEAIEMTDYPPTARDVSSIIVTGTTASGTSVATVTCQLGFGYGSDRIWGPAHTVEDTSGNTTWSLSTSETKFEANIYAQAWFTLCDAFRIVITFTESVTINGEAAACVS